MGEHSADDRTGLQMVDDNGSRCVSGRVPHCSVDSSGSASPNALDREIGAMCGVFGPTTAVSRDRDAGDSLLLIENRVSPLTIWRFFVYAPLLRDDVQSGKFAPTVILNGCLILAAVMTTTLSSVIQMWRRHAFKHDLERGPGQNASPNSTRRTWLGASEEINLLLNQSREATPAQLSHFEWPRPFPPAAARPKQEKIQSLTRSAPLKASKTKLPPPRLPPPSEPLPQPPQQSPVTPPPSPLLPPLPSPTPPQPPPSLSLWSQTSESIAEGPGDGRDAYLATAPSYAWSFIGQQ